MRVAAVLVVMTVTVKPHLYWRVKRFR